MRQKSLAVELCLTSSSSSRSPPPRRAPSRPSTSPRSRLAASLPRYRQVVQPCVRFSKASTVVRAALGAGSGGGEVGQARFLRERGTRRQLRDVAPCSAREREMGDRASGYLDGCAPLLHERQRASERIPLVTTACRRADTEVQQQHESLRSSPAFSRSRDTLWRPCRRGIQGWRGRGSLIVRAAPLGLPAKSPATSFPLLLALPRFRPCRFAVTTRPADCGARCSRCGERLVLATR